MILPKNKLRSAATIIGGGPKENREGSDFYPTPPDVTHALMKFLNMPAESHIWEPACGNGDMAEVIKSYGHQVFSTDLRRTGYGIGGVDYLKHKPEPGKVRRDAIITNPPFNLAEEFIVQSLKIAPVVAMVLKSSYWHAKKREQIYRDNPPAWILPLTWRPDFMKGGSPTMDFIWTVWISGNTNCTYMPLSKPEPVTNQTNMFT